MRLAARMLRRNIRSGTPVAFPRCLLTTRPRGVAELNTQSTKPTGDISSVFPSLSGTAAPPLPARFASLKQRLIRGHEDAVCESWHRLIADLEREVNVIRSIGSSIVPEIAFSDVKYNNIPKMTDFRDKLRKRGVAVIRGVVSEQEAMGWKELVKRYIRMNPGITGFPTSNPAVYELYWSPSQILARAHPNVLKVQSFLMSHWHSASKSALISTSHPVTYADRLRIRQPSDTGFALGPHMDGGSVERWEEEGYGVDGLYSPIFEGRYEAYDPWESSRRLSIQPQLHSSPGGCSVYRMFQGWLSLSTSAAYEGTLLIYPALSLSTAYLLLRPFFSPIHPPSHPAYLSPSNWRLDPSQTTTLQGALPGTSQELNSTLHPHLDLRTAMTHIPTVQPGDYIAWHSDTVHAVDSIHAGSTDASALYIPACPLTEANAAYLARQREAFAEGTPPPDFPAAGGTDIGAEAGNNEDRVEKGESGFKGRLQPDFVMRSLGFEALRGMGLARWDDSGVESKRPRGEGAIGEKRLLERANEILGFGLNDDDKYD